MTKREKQLIKFAKEIIELNSKNETSLILTGSLSLLLQGIKLPRECTDIDFLCSPETIPEDRYYHLDEWYSPILPKGFIVSYDGKRSQPDAIKYYNVELDIKIDMLPEYGDCTYVGDMRVSDTYETLEAKYDYFKNDYDKYSKQKHFEDITYILKKNKKHFEYWNYTYKEWIEQYGDYIKLIKN